MDEIERIARASESALRAELMADMMNDSHERKIKRSQAVVGEFVDIITLPEVYVSTSGGKDSAVLSDLCKKLYPESEIMKCLKS